MNTVRAALETELKASENLKQQYEQELAKLPPGTLVKKNIKGNSYYYRVMREGDKVYHHYLGKLTSQEIKVESSSKEMRLEYKRRLQDVKQEITLIEKLLHYEERMR
jgi:hypothetical protein